MRTLGYVAVEFNQASSEPRIIGDIYTDPDDAQDVADQAHTETVRVGRRERYSVARLELEVEP